MAWLAGWGVGVFGFVWAPFPGGTVWRPEVSGLAGITRLRRWPAGWLASSGTSASASPTPSAVRLGAVLLQSPTTTCEVVTGVFCNNAIDSAKADKARDALCPKSVLLVWWLGPAQLNCWPVWPIACFNLFDLSTLYLFGSHGPPKGWLCYAELGAFRGSDAQSFCSLSAVRTSPS